MLRGFHYSEPRRTVCFRLRRNVGIIQLFGAGCAAVFICGAFGAQAAPTLAQCNGMKDLAFVSHQDDDLLFMNPDLENTMHAGGCVQVVYLTASDRGEGEGYMLGRERGVRAAYAYSAAVANQWTQGVAAFKSKRILRFTLDLNRRVSLMHVRIRDPWLGKGWGSLTPLSRVESVPGQIARSIGSHPETYSRAELVALIAAIIKDYEPTTVRHMDASIAVPYTSLCWRCVGHDHPDHIASARLVLDALKTAPGNYAEVGYVDYPTQERSANLTASEVANKSNVFRQYASNDYRYCPGSQAVCKEPAGTAASWVGRAYYVARRGAPAALVSNPGGGYLLFVTGEVNAAVNMHGDRADHWSSLGGRTAGPVAAFNFHDGRVGLLVRDATGRLWSNDQRADGQLHGWRSFKGERITGLPVVGSNADGRRAVVALGNDGTFRYAAQAALGSGWSLSWSALPPLDRALPHTAMTPDAGGRLVVFASDRDGSLWATAQIRPGSGKWTHWHRLEEVSTSGGLAAMCNAWGLIELYARDKRSGRMLRIVQSMPGGPEGTWRKAQDLGFVYTGRPSIALNEKGSISVAALERPGGALQLVEERTVRRIGDGVDSTPALRLVNGTLYLVGRSDQPGQSYRIWARAKGEWRALPLIPPPSEAGGTSFVEALQPGTRTLDQRHNLSILSAGLEPGFQAFPQDANP